MVIRMGRELQTQEDVNAAAAKCLTALMPPSVAQTFTCLGIDLSKTDAVSGQVQNFSTNLKKDMAQLESIFAGTDPFKSGGKINVTKGQCESLYATKTLQCYQIMLASDPLDYATKTRSRLQSTSFLRAAPISERCWAVTRLRKRKSNHSWPGVPRT